MHLLVVEDDVGVRNSLQRALKLEGYTVSLAEDGEDAMSWLAVNTPDAMIMDVSMPRMDGLELCRAIREAGDRTPILMLTAHDTIDDRVIGLDAGADDYLVKPFAVRELRARVRALLRRHDPGTTETLTFADVILDPQAYEIRRGPRRIDMSKTEFHLLELFMRNPRQAMSRSMIFEQVWGYDFGATSNALGVYVGYVRRKLEAGGEPRLLHTVRGVGYILRDES